MTVFRRGQVWTYKPVLDRPDQSLLRLIVSADGLNDSPIPVVLGCQVVEQDPGSLLAVRIEDHGWVVVTTIEQVVKRRLVEVAGVIAPSEQQDVDAALRAAQDL